MYRGLKWYKCDLHLHTPVSECFLDKEIEPESFLEKAKKKRAKYNSNNRS